MADTKKLIDVEERTWSYNDIQYWVNPTDKTVNAIIKFNDKLARLRAGIIILKNDTILLGEEADEPGVFSLPGGGLEKGETPVDAAIREAQEEVYINVKNAHDTEYDYCECHTELKKWVKENVPKSKQWYNYYTCLVIAEYDSDYLGKVDAVDKDPAMNGSCRWYKIKDVINKPGFKKQWKKALIDYGYYKELTEAVDKKAQFDIIQKYNPRDPEINKFAYWVTKADDIKEYQEAMAEYSRENSGPCDYTPDWKWSDMEAAIQKGYITIYSSKPIIKGNFVTPSKMLAQSYGMIGNNSKTVPLSYVAWLDVGEGQYTGKVASLKEDTRNILISKSRNADPYKYNVRGKNRFERKKYSKVAKTVKQFNDINMNELFKQDILTITIPVTGETANYNVNIRMEGVVAEIHKNIKSNNNKLEFRTVIQALTKVFNTANIKVKCQCPDFKYRYQHALIINNNNIDGTDKDPGPGHTGMANTKGQGCKHILLCLNNGDWLLKVASCIKNYIFYAEEHMQKAFMNIIFPKLYGMDAEQAKEEKVIPENTNLETDKHIIETINDWAAKRGRLIKGSNINPVYADKLEKEQKTAQNADKK